MLLAFALSCVVLQIIHLLLLWHEMINHEKGLIIIIVHLTVSLLGYLYLAILVGGLEDVGLGFLLIAT